MYIVSRCLLGYNCKYNGGNNRNEDVIEFCRFHEYMTVCPESAGGLTAPRAPAEHKIVGGEVKVIDKNGRDLTKQFTEGAEISYNEIKDAVKNGTQIEGAILKANSPSCGYGKIYDGNFTGTLVKGNGLFADRIEQDGIRIVNEKNLKKIWRDIYD